MRKILASVVTAVAVFAAAPALAADMPEYEIDIPDVDYDIGGSFYLRGSAGLNLHWAREVRHDPAWAGQVVHQIDSLGYGYSWGVGFGYETGTGLRFDATIDTLETKGIGITKTAGLPDVNGKYKLMLRSTIAMANAYYDFKFGDMGFGGYGSDGGMFGYVGGGVGLAWNHAEVNLSPDDPTSNFTVPTGGNISPAAAIMAGVGYDMGTWVADVGYRGLYIHQINNSPTDPVTNPGRWYAIDNNFIHELRGTVRYRFN
jgi:opacity protein-like surface antigen